MKKRLVFISIIVIILLGIILCNISLSDSNDTFYLIKIGESIFKNGLDLKDHYSWIAGLSYTYPHWLYSILIYFIFHNFGFIGIYLGCIIVFIILGIIIYYVNLKINKSNLLALIITIISMFSLSMFILPRSQSISIIFLFLEVYFIHKLINTGKIKYSVYLALCSLIIANIHATIWIVFFIFFLPFFAEHIVYLICKKKILFNKISIDNIENIKLLIVTFGICLLMGLLTPSRICYTYLFRIMLGNSQNYISEHQMLQFLRYPLLIFSCIMLLFNKSKISLSELLMIGGIVLMTIISERHIIFFCTIGLLFLSIVLKRNLDNKKDKTFDILDNKLYYCWKVPVILIIILSFVSYYIVSNNLKTDFIDKKIYPVDVVSYIKENLDYENMKIINNYDFGSYLLFNDIKVFVDSRCDLYLKEFNNQEESILDDYYELFNTKEILNYNEYLKKYQADYFLIYKEDLLDNFLSKDSNYRLIYDDESFSLYHWEGGINENKA